MEKRYHKWEIGLPSSTNPGKEGLSTGQVAEISLIKTRATKGTSKPTHTYFVGLITLQKYEAVKDLMLSLLDNFSLFHHYLFIMTFFCTNKNQKYLSKDFLKDLLKEDR